MLMLALEAVRHSPAVSDRYNQLVARGRKKSIAQVAVMRRLLRVAWVLTLRRTPWNEDLFRTRGRSTSKGQAVQEQSSARKSA